MIGQLNEVASYPDEHQAPSVERGLFRVMALLSGTAAMAWDSGTQKQAQRYYQLALREAHARDDPVLGANVLAGMARQMLYQERPQDALELVRLAEKSAGRAAGSRVRAMLHTREAWAYAAMDCGAAFRRATTEAAEALADASSGDEPYWIAYFDEAELAGVTGGRLLGMARQDPKQHAADTADSISRALAVRGPNAGRSHALDVIGLAECHFLMGDVTGAVTCTRTACEAATRTQSDRVRTQLGQLYPYAVGRDTSQAVGEARTTIRDLLSS